jgi:hypothetical protein
MTEVRRYLLPWKCPSVEFFVTWKALRGLLVVLEVCIVADTWNTINTTE